MTDDNQLITQDELSARYGIPTARLENWRTRKVGPPYVKIGHNVRYRMSDLLAWENSRRVGTSEAAV